MIPACLWASPLLATVMDPVSPASASPLPKAMLTLSTLAFESETDPMLISPLVVKLFAPSSLTVSGVPVSSVWMGNKTEWDMAAHAVVKELSDEWSVISIYLPAQTNDNDSKLIFILNIVKF